VYHACLVADAGAAPQFGNDGDVDVVVAQAPLISTTALKLKGLASIANLHGILHNRSHWTKTWDVVARLEVGQARMIFADLVEHDGRTL